MSAVWSGEQWTEDQIKQGWREERYICLGEFYWRGAMTRQNVPRDIAILFELRELRREVAELRALFGTRQEEP